MNVENPIEKDSLYELCKEVKTKEIEYMAMLLHLAAKHMIDNHPERLITTDKRRPFQEWDDLSEEQKEGKREQAQFILDRVKVVF